MMRRWWLLALFLLFSAPVLAHKASDSYLMLDVKGREVSGQWDIALRDIDFALGLDADGNGEITWGELRARHADIAAWALARLALQRGGECRLEVADHLVDEHTDGAYAVLSLSGTCPAGGGDLQIDYRLLFDLDALHRGLLRLGLDGTSQTAVLAPQRAQQQFAAAEISRLAQFGQYLVEGIWHIWIGFDHILFLLSLLLPAVLVHEAGRWRGVGRFRESLVEVLWVVTAFTLAHSITLSLAALGLIELPSRLVESAIAASVVLAAANNLKPLVEHRRWMVAFGFGLIHGFGFASVLAELGLPQETLVLSLLGFNVGVEIGQLAIVAVFLPSAWFLRQTPFYRRGIYLGGSVLTLVIALVWFIERAFDLKLISA
ncbi:MAG: HupE/UreJ family protein [Sterolibacteriaceae bacterium]|nr:HupE/UreJ family protein [Sterolibacteriaceae bacterium]